MLVVPRNFLVDENEPFLKGAVSLFLFILKKIQNFVKRNSCHIVVLSCQQLLLRYLSVDVHVGNRLQYHIPSTMILRQWTKLYFNIKFKFC